MFSLKDKITLVTGAGSGIGAAIAETFAKAGGFVFVTDRDAKTGSGTVENIRAAGGQAEFLALDVSNEADCERVGNAVKSRFGRLDVLVNNAGIGHVGTMLTTSGADLTASGPSTCAASSTSRRCFSPAWSRANPAAS